MQGNGRVFCGRMEALAHREQWASETNQPPFPLEVLPIFAAELCLALQLWESFPSEPGSCLQSEKKGLLGRLEICLFFFECWSPMMSLISLGFGSICLLVFSLRLALTESFFHCTCDAFFCTSSYHPLGCSFQIAVAWSHESYGFSVVPTKSDAARELVLQC